MLAVKKASELLGLNYKADEAGSFVLSQDGIVLKFYYDSSHVYKDGHIMYIMEGPAVNDQGKAYVPLSFFTDYLGTEISFDDKNQLVVSDDSNFSLYNVVQFLPQEIHQALKNQDYPHREEIINAVRLPSSLDIDIPKINMEKIIDTKPLDAFSYDFKGELREHGYTEEEISRFSYHDFKVIESTWQLTEEMINSIKNDDPELAEKDLSQWTIGDYQKYYKERDKKNLELSFTEEQLAQLNQRGILMEDAFYLLKEFQQMDRILAQPDEVLRRIMEGYYQLRIDALQ
ncbi:MAG: stalk domain-containing protein [Dehalobacterium sp.]|jgi:hypothetical protein